MGRVARSRSSRILLLLAVMSVVLAFATTARGSSDRLFYGESVQVGDGIARTYVLLRDGRPHELGIALQSAAVSSLPAHQYVEGEHMSEVHMLPLPAEVTGVPFTFAELNWNPAGHEPSGVYDLPHFDFHFWTTSAEERMSIDPVDPEFVVKSETYPASEEMPAGFTAFAPAVPLMGMHWIDPAAAELNGTRFTTTLLYGTWNGNLVFIEPMIAREFLQREGGFHASFPVPERVRGAGWWPSSYVINNDVAAGEYRVALTDFVARG